MDERSRSLQELQHIKQMMERSSRFISLSSLSGISAGLCGLAGAWVAKKKIDCWQGVDCSGVSPVHSVIELLNYLLLVAIVTFVAAFIAAFIFTLYRSKKAGVSLWGSISLRLFWNISIPIVVGGFFLLRAMQLGQFELLAPGCLLFYGLGLVNAGKYTLREVTWLGYTEIVLGLISLWVTDYGLYFWGAGFGILHIVFGLVMWFRHERNIGTQSRTVPA